MKKVIFYLLKILHELRIDDFEQQFKEKNYWNRKTLLILTIRFEERTSELERRFQNLLNILLRMNEPVYQTKNDIIEIDIPEDSQRNRAYLLKVILINILIN